MSRFFAARRIALALVLVLLASAGATPAHAQCSITGPDVLCGGSVTLCGPSGNYEYHWSSAMGPITGGQCIDVSSGGNYALQLFDLDLGVWYDPCYHFVSAGSTPTCSITGPTSACAGQTVQLCGPAGNVNYSWSGPAGFTASTACVDVGVEGTYVLTVDDPAGCGSSTCQQTVTFPTCGTTPPPPPTSPPTTCPRGPWFWMRACRPSTANAAGPVSRELLTQIASCISQRSTLFEWDNPVAGFCSTMRPEGDGLRGRARRQVVVVWANVCAGALTFADAGGFAVVLDPTTPVHLPQYDGTVGAWLTQAEASLASFDGMSSRNMRDHGVQQTLKDIITVGWSINHGVGIGSVCQLDLGLVASGGEGDLRGGPADDLSLAQELAVAEGGLMLAAPQPNPFNRSTSFAYWVEGDDAADVHIGVYDVSGRLVRALVDGRMLPGAYQARWDGRDASGTPARGGLYFVMGRIGAQRVQTRVTLLQ